jgi:hypothetical protein
MLMIAAALCVDDDFTASFNPFAATYRTTSSKEAQVRFYSAGLLSSRFCKMASRKVIVVSIAAL